MNCAARAHLVDTIKKKYCSTMGLRSATGYLISWQTQNRGEQTLKSGKKRQ
jgi:hypothetical protein